MERTLCVWFPEWALQNSAAQQADLPHQAVGSDNRVVARDARAAKAGVAIGMQRKEAEALCPTVVTVERDPGAEAIAFEPVVCSVEALVPHVEVVEPGLLFVPLEGAVRYYGGEGPLVERVAKELPDGRGWRMGVAGGPFAAHRAAERASEDRPIFLVEDDAGFLASLDVAALGSEDLAAVFRWLGITTLGALSRLPRDAVVSRFGRQGLEAHRIAGGETRSLLVREVPRDFTVEERFDPPLANLEQGAFVARALANELVSRLTAEGTAAHRVLVEGRAEDGTVRARIWRSADPFDTANLSDRVRWQLRAWVEGSGVRGGLVALKLVPADLSGEGRQSTLFEDLHSEAETQRALAEVQALVGVDGLLQARPQGGRDPWEQVVWHRWGETPAAIVRDPSAPWPGRLPSPAPALVPPDPRSVTMEWDAGLPSRIRLGSRWEPVLSWAGPWRRTGRWWEGEDAADRYQIVTSVGAFLCEVKDGEAWVLGIYD